MEYAKAWSAALAVLVSFIVGEVWIELPEAVTLALGTVITGAVVARVGNKQPAAGSESGQSVVEALLVVFLALVILIVVLRLL
jgi:hypothetical protein